MIALIMGLLGSLAGHLVSLRRSQFMAALGDIHFDKVLLQASNFHYVSSEEKREAEKVRINAEFAELVEKELNENRWRRLSLITLGDGTVLAVLVIIAIVTAFASM